MLRVVVLLLGVLVISVTSYQRCGTVCREEDVPPPFFTNPPPNALRGKAGKRGEKGDKGDPGDSCVCPQMQQEIMQLRRQLEELQKPRDCYDVKNSNRIASSGIYTIYPPFNNPDGYQVYCDMDTDGGGWTVFQKRFDGSEDFYRGWDDYVTGFGDLDGEFWLGLELVHQLTKYGSSYDLRIDLTDFEQNSAYAQYSSFSLGAGGGYRLNYGDYSGDAGDSLQKQDFGTKDNDQDESDSENCAILYKGAWWYRSCHISNLNGLYLRGKTDQFATGMVWKTWKGYHYALRTSEMKFRPRYV